ncbi:hypothetical protein [Ferrovum sp.]|uniref:hypothetical protein n=1 Tax=Ferrovum sp. TaxID=2609467 RepID=UPI002634A2AC|nr:hypothetical protein [Ferrovum sp.]
MLHSTGSWSALKEKRDKNGKRWNFSYWHTFSFVTDNRAQRLFFWDDDHKESGVVLLLGDQSQPYASIRNLVDRLVSSPELRKQHSRELRFPLERYYREFGSFPDEINGKA